MYVPRTSTFDTDAQVHKETRLVGLLPATIHATAIHSYLGSRRCDHLPVAVPRGLFLLGQAGDHHLRHAPLCLQQQQQQQQQQRRQAVCGTTSAALGYNRYRSFYIAAPPTQSV